MQPNDLAECPFCLGRMQLEDRDGESWMVCPNGCPTELKILTPQPAIADPAALHVRAASSSK